MRLSIKRLCNCLSMIFLIISSSYFSISFFLNNKLRKWGNKTPLPTTLLEGHMATQVEKRIPHLRHSKVVVMWLDSDQWVGAEEDFLVTFFEGSCLSSFCPFYDWKGGCEQLWQHRQAHTPGMKYWDRRNGQNSQPVLDCPLTSAL